MGFRVGREPRQPQKHKGAVVHTEKTPGYDDTLTQNLVHEAIMGEAHAQMEFTKEMQAPVPSDASDIDKREEPTMPRAKNGRQLRNGQQSSDVVHAITTYAKVGQTFTAEQVWEGLGKKKRAEWVEAYGGRDASFRKVKVALNNLNYSGRIGIERVSPQVFKYTSPNPVTPSEAYKRTMVSKGKKSKMTIKTKDPVDKPVSKPATVVKATRATEHEGFRSVGVDYDGNPLYVEHKTGRVGHVKVVVQFVAV